MKDFVQIMTQKVEGLIGNPEKIGMNGSRNPRREEYPTILHKYPRKVVESRDSNNRALLLLSKMPKSQN